MMKRATAALWLAGLLALSGAAAAAPIAVTDHTQEFNGQRVDYQARVERFDIGDEKAGAHLVAISYLARPDDRQRPVVFVFNGGPISPSIYLHGLALGPWRLHVPDELDADPSTFRWAPNPHTVLDVADLVFFDPAGTGWSQLRADTPHGHYLSNQTDAEQLADFVRAWCRRHHRCDAPKYLFGESYGTMRAAEASRQLVTGDDPVRLDGVYLMGQALNIIETVYRPANVMSYVTSLPTMAALGWYHGRVERQGRSFEGFLDEVRGFANGEFLVALVRGGALPMDERQRIAARLEQLTGVAAERYLDADLRISRVQFRRELLRDQGLVIGANDGRYAARPTADNPLPDGSAVVFGPLFEHFNRYLRQQLGADTGFEYRTQSPVGGLHNWDWGNASPFGDWPYMAALRQAMEAAPGLRLMIGVGYHDNLTTVGATEHAVAQAGWPAARTAVRYYHGGHMAYTIEDSLVRLAADLREFVTSDGEME